MEKIILTEVNNLSIYDIFKSKKTVQISLVSFIAKVQSFDWASFNEEFPGYKLSKEADDFRKYWNEELRPLSEYLSYFHIRNNELQVRLLAPSTANFDFILCKNNEESEFIQISLARDAKVTSLQKQAFEKQDIHQIYNPLLDIQAEIIALNLQYEEKLKCQNLSSDERKHLKDKISENKKKIFMNSETAEMVEDSQLRQRQIPLIKEAIQRKISKKNSSQNFSISTLIIVYRADDSSCFPADECLNNEEISQLNNFCLECKVFEYYNKICFVHINGKQGVPKPILLSSVTS